MEVSLSYLYFRLDKMSEPLQYMDDPGDPDDDDGGLCEAGTGSTVKEVVKTCTQCCH